ncbi:MAG TPA: hypothetical protein VGJ91_05590 [Polyangiaceae bacterium]|jgi:hypothetical protein
MATLIEKIVETYIEVWGERDPARRATMIEACFAPEGRIVTRGRDIVGRAAFDAAVADFQVRTEFRQIRLTSVIDAARTTFRFRGVVELADGTSAESFDAGEIDATGRIAILLTFVGPLADPATSALPKA